MIVDDECHTMPMKCSQGLQQAIHRSAEVMQPLNNDHIDFVPGNGAEDRRQPWQPVPALRDGLFRPLHKPLDLGPESLEKLSPYQLLNPAVVAEVWVKFPRN
jgi:hypothetical protein